MRDETLDNHPDIVEMQLDNSDELRQLFARSTSGELSDDIVAELESIMRLHDLSAQELFYKWESFCIKMGAEQTQLTLENARALKLDIQEALERESRSKSHLRSADKRNAALATPRHVQNSANVFGMLDDLVPTTPQTRPVPPSSSRLTPKATPSHMKTPETPQNRIIVPTTPFSQRQARGQVLESINSHLAPPTPPIVPFAEPRVKPVANTDIKKFSYQPMSMHLSSSSEVLDTRIDEFLEMFQSYHGLDDMAFGNAAQQSTKEIIAVGRIGCDALDGKLNTASMVLEVSRRAGAGLRVPLKTESLPSTQFFPGQIVALRGINPAGSYFTVHEVLSVPLLPQAASSPETFNQITEKVGGLDAAPLNYLIASGPYTADDNLNFEPLNEICRKAAEQVADVLVLIGPFLDLEHPLLASGDFDLPEMKGVDPDTATLSTFFRYAISTPIQELAHAVPSITILMIPSVRDLASKHVSWPQEALPKKELGLPRQARMVSNPITLSLNETLLGISANDVLWELKTEEATGGRPETQDLFSRLCRYVIEQRHFMPVFPPSARSKLPRPGTESGLAAGAMVDVNYLKLGDWWNVRPDVLILPSALPPFVKVVEGTLVINPGHISKRKAAWTYARMTLHPRRLTEEEQHGKQLAHKVYERARVDILKI